MTENTINADVTMSGGASGTLLAGRYRVVRQLGQGGMGSVWLAEDTKLDGFKVAIKMLPSVLVNNKRAYAQVKAEALVSLKLSHPNIVTVRAFEEESGSPFLVMDYIDGQTLDEYLAEKGKLTEEETIRLLKPVAAALDYAHTQGVVHRDVKPGNVMIRRDGTPFVLDFGIAREIQETMTRVTGKLSSGTLMYMSPEQLNGDAPKPTQDIYSFAAMVYECLKGEPPFVRGGIEDQIKHKTPDLLDEHIAIRSQVMAGLEKTPDARPATCAAVLIARILSESSTALNAGRIEGADAEVMSVRSGRIRRARTMRRISLWLLLATGSAVSFAVCRQTPVVYEAKSEFTMDIRRSVARGQDALSQAMPDYSIVFAEVLETRIPDWRSEKIVNKIVQHYRANYPASTIPDEELISTIMGAKIELVRNSHIITISVRSKSKELCAVLANAYAESIESFTDEENKFRCDKAVAHIHANVEKKRHEADKIKQALLDFQTTNKVDSLRSTRETLDAEVKRITVDIAQLETEETQLAEWEKMLEEAQKDPATYDNRVVSVPQAQEIATEFTDYQDASEAYQRLIFAFTESHPEVIKAKKSMELARQRFQDASARALLNGRSTLRVLRNLLASMKARQEDMRAELGLIEQQIVLAESGHEQLEAELGVANRVLEGLILDENKARMDAESNNEIVRVGCPATVPDHPVSADQVEIYAIGLSASLFLWVVFCLFTLVLARKNAMRMDDR